MEIACHGILNRIDKDMAYVSVVNEFGIEIDLVLPIQMFSHWESVYEGDFLVYRVWQKDIVFGHSVDYVEPPRLTDNELREIDERFSKLFLD